MTDYRIPWLLKAIWIPCFIVVIVCTSAVAVFIVKESGWESPYRWLCMAGAASFLLDKWITS